MIELFYNVDRSYQGDVAFFCSNSTLQSLRLLKDSQGRYLAMPFLDPIINEWVERINGKPIVVTNSLHNFTSGAGTGTGTPFMLCFPPRLYMIRDVGGMNVQTDPYTLQSYGQLQVNGFLRSDGQYIGPNRSISYLTCA